MLNWYALNSKPHSEKIVHDGLSARGIEVYLPVLQAPTHGARAALARPFFPSYLFAHVDLDRVGLSALQYLPGVRRLVFCGDQPAPVPQAAIDRIRLRLKELEKGITDGAGEPLAPGDRVLITSGPLAGLEAVFDRRLSSEERVRVLINFLQRGMHVDIEREAVRKIRIGQRPEGLWGVRGSSRRR